MCHAAAIWAILKKNFSKGRGDAGSGYVQGKPPPDITYHYDLSLSLLLRFAEEALTQQSSQESAPKPTGCRRTELSEAQRKRQRMPSAAPALAVSATRPSPSSKANRWATALAAFQASRTQINQGIAAGTVRASTASTTGSPASSAALYTAWLLPAWKEGAASRRKSSKSCEETLVFCPFKAAWPLAIASNTGVNSFAPEGLHSQRFTGMSHAVREMRETGPVQSRARSLSGSGPPRRSHGDKETPGLVLSCPVLAMIYVPVSQVTCTSKESSPARKPTASTEAFQGMPTVTCAPPALRQGRLARCSVPSSDHKAQSSIPLYALLLLKMSGPNRGLWPS